MKQTLEEAAREAIHAHYNCNANKRSYEPSRQQPTGGMYEGSW